MNHSILDDIDDQIDRLEAQLLRLRKRRNTLIPFLQLPTEILIRILIYTQNDVVEFAQENTPSYMSNIFHSACGMQWSKLRSENQDLHWIRIMSSCVQLREIAMTTPQLWQHEGIQLPGNEQWIDICIDRARGLPLTLYYIPPLVKSPTGRRSDPEIHSRHTALIYKYLSQVIEAYFNISAAGYSSSGGDYDDAISSAGPQLRSMSFSWGLLGIQRDFIRHASQSLTTLVLGDIWGFSSNTTRFPNLRYLMISMLEQDIDDESDLNILEWVNGLQMLEVFSMEYAYAEVDRGELISITELPMVTLPKLRVLRVRSSIPGVLKLLRSLPLHGVSGLDIQINEDHFPWHATVAREVIDDYARIIHQAVQFWDRNHAVSNLGPLKAELVNPTIMSEDHLYRTRLSLTSAPIWNPVDLGRPFCCLDGPYSTFDQPALHPHITTICLKEHQDRLDPTIFGFISEYGLDNLQIDTMVLEGFQSHRKEKWMNINLEILEHWLTERKAQGRSVQHLYIGQQASSEAQIRLQEFAEDLQERKIVAEIHY